MKEDELELESAMLKAAVMKAHDELDACGLIVPRDVSHRGLAYRIRQLVEACGGRRRTYTELRIAEMERQASMPPEVRFTSEGVVNWPEFESWALRNFTVWHRAFSYCRMTGTQDQLKIVTHQITLENRRLNKAIEEYARKTGIVIPIPPEQ
jgi:hypothetical protein